VGQRVAPSSRQFNKTISRILRFAAKSAVSHLSLRLCESSKTFDAVSATSSWLSRGDAGCELHGKLSSEGDFGQWLVAPSRSTSNKERVEVHVRLLGEEGERFKFLANGGVAACFDPFAWLAQFPSGRNFDIVTCGAIPDRPPDDFTDFYASPAFNMASKGVEIVAKTNWRRATNGNDNRLGVFYSQ
jgi:hypothetical protein